MLKVLTPICSAARRPKFYKTTQYPISSPCSCFQGYKSMPPTHHSPPYQRQAPQIIGHILYQPVYLGAIMGCILQIIFKELQSSKNMAPQAKSRSMTPCFWIFEKSFWKKLEAYPQVPLNFNFYYFPFLKEYIYI